MNCAFLQYQLIGVLPFGTTPIRNIRKKGMKLETPKKPQNL